MAKHKTHRETLAAEAISILKDTIRDLEVVGAGRSNWERRHCIISNLFKVHDLMNEIDKKPEAKPSAAPRITNGHVIPASHRLTHVNEQHLFDD